MKIVSWNINGMRAAFKKGFAESLAKLDPDIIFLQEIKMQADQMTGDMDLKKKGYKLLLHPAQRKGYSGVAVYTRLEPDKVSLGTGSDFDEEGRVIRLDFGDLSIYGIYFPNGGSGEERLDYKMRFYDHYLEEFSQLKEEGRHVIVCGDFNVAHKEIDLANPERNQKTSGFLPVERDWFQRLLDRGFVDVFRRRNPDTVIYTWWDQRFRARDRNMGWRIDYFVVDEKTEDLVKDTEILNDYMGSDHCPVTLLLDWEARPAVIPAHEPDSIESMTETPEIPAGS